MKGLVYDATSRRVWLYGQRIHHGAVGVLLLTAGIGLAIHDRRDWVHWFIPGDSQGRILQDQSAHQVNR